MNYVCVIGLKCDRIEGCLDEWVNGNKFFHCKLTGLGTYTHKYI